MTIKDKLKHLYKFITGQSSSSDLVNDVLNDFSIALGGEAVVLNPGDFTDFGFKLTPGYIYLFNAGVNSGSDLENIPTIIKSFLVGLDYNLEINSSYILPVEDIYLMEGMTICSRRFGIYNGDTVKFFSTLSGISWDEFSITVDFDFSGIDPAIYTTPILTLTIHDGNNISSEKICSIACSCSNPGSIIAGVCTLYFGWYPAIVYDGDHTAADFIALIENGNAIYMSVDYQANLL